MGNVDRTEEIVNGSETAINGQDRSQRAQLIIFALSLFIASSHLTSLFTFARKKKKK